MIKFYSQSKTMKLIDATDIEGSSPPAVFVGRYGYPKVDIGPLIPPEFGDTSIMDKPELWGNKSIDEITDFKKGGKIVDQVQEMALIERPIDIEARFSSKPKGRVILDDEIQPFGPSARMDYMKAGNGRMHKYLERSFYDTDMKAADAVLNAYRNGTLISEYLRDGA